MGFLQITWSVFYLYKKVLWWILFRIFIKLEQIWMLEDRVSNLKDKCRNTLKSEGIGPDILTGVCIFQGSFTLAGGCQRRLFFKLNVSPVI